MHNARNRNKVLNLKDKFRALKIPYGIPTVGQLPNQLPKATNLRPRTKSATKSNTKSHAPNQLLYATHQISYYIARPRYGWRSARRSRPARRVRNDPWAGAWKGIPQHGHPLTRPVYGRPRVLSTDKLGHAPNFIFSRGAITPAREGTSLMVPFFFIFLPLARPVYGRPLWEQR
jgi:hypothetical protein